MYPEYFHIQSYLLYLKLLSLRLKYEIIYHHIIFLYISAHGNAMP